jgi:hypothetical protein
MSVGYPSGKSDLDARLGLVTVQVRDAFEDVARLKEWLDERTIEDLQAMGYNSTEAAIAKDAINDLWALGQIAHAQREQVGQNDFFFHAKHLLGLN